MPHTGTTEYTYMSSTVGPVYRPIYWLCGCITAYWPLCC